LIGILLLCLGVNGEYIGRIYQEVRKRPRFVVRRVLESHEEISEKTLTAVD
jgi:undecaprenyl-phosphate 4-deoxy-4-formamido-L-arabinose transferase